MAHYIAELMHDAEAAEGHSRAEKNLECRKAILELWKARHELPDGSRPFEDFEPMFRALANIDPENTVPRYYRPQRRPSAREESQDTIQWLDLVEGLDSSARILIDFCLSKAGESASENARAWIAAARGEVSGKRDIALVEHLVAMIDRLEQAPKDNTERKLLEDRLARLETFRALADVAASDIAKLLANKPDTV